MTADPTPAPNTDPTDDPKTDPPAPDPDPAAAKAEDRLRDDHPVVKALAKANEEAKQARLKVKEFEDRDKTETERVAEKAAELEKNLTTAQADAVRFEIALDKGLTKSQAKRLVGSSREELEADAEELLADLGTKPIIPSRPSGQGGGSAPSDASETRSPADLAAAVVRQRGY